MSILEKSLFSSLKLTKNHHSLCQVEEFVHVGVQGGVSGSDHPDRLHAHSALTWVIHFDLLIASQPEVSPLPEVSKEGQID